jgi:hypothetical protein
VAKTSGCYRTSAEADEIIQGEVGRLSWRPLSFQTKRAMSLIGTKRTRHAAGSMSAFGGKADMGGPVGECARGGRSRRPPLPIEAGIFSFARTPSPQPCLRAQCAGKLGYRRCNLGLQRVLPPFRLKAKTALTVQLQFGSRIWNKAVAVRHRYFRQRRSIYAVGRLDDFCLGKDIGNDGINVVVAERARCV